MKIKDLINEIDYELNRDDLNPEITNIALNSKEIKEDGLFFCIRGAKVDGHQYIENAIEKGTKAILVEEFPEKEYEDILLIKVKNSEISAGDIAAKFYDNPSEKLKVIAITGTKGKTTVAEMIKHIISEAGYKCGSIGTIGIEYDSFKLHTNNTTPDSLTIQKYLNEMVKAGCEFVVMETSSQSYKRHRVQGLNIDTGVFLNIDRDHIGEGEHADFEEYLNCKREIFKLSKTKIINQNSKYWKHLEDEDKKDGITFNDQGKGDYTASNIKPFIDNNVLGISFTLSGKLNGNVVIPIPGSYNVPNALAAIAVADHFGIDSDTIFKALSTSNPRGRSQLIPRAAELGKKVIIDYAHNKLSFESILTSIRDYNPARLICMFGLEWDETKLRRYDEGYYAGKYSDFIVLTCSNMRSGYFDKVNEDVIRGLEESNTPYVTIENRKDAIEYAVEMAKKDDIVLLLGLGSDEELLMGDKKVAFNEEQIVIDYLENKEKSKIKCL